MEKTKPSPYVQRNFFGYTIGTFVSSGNQHVLAGLQQKFVDEFGKAMQPHAPSYLHITLLDWLAPLVDYGKDKKQLFEEIFEEYDNAMQVAAKDIGPITINFNSVNISPEAIFIMGSDNGQYQNVRQRFLNNVKLLPNTKMPPKIIHTTVARFTKEIPLSSLEDFAKLQTINFKEQIDYFGLYCDDSSKDPIRELIKTYYLK